MANGETKPSENKPLRIGILSYRSDPHVGGQGIILKYLSSALANLGHSVSIISGPPYPELVAPVGLVKLASLDLYAQPHHGHYALRLRHLKSWADTYEYFGHLSGKFVEPYTYAVRAFDYLKANRGQFDVILDNQCLGKDLARIERELGLPIVHLIHHPITKDLALGLASEQNWGRRQLIRRWYSFIGMQIKTARKAKRIITVSKASAGDVATAFGLDTNKIITIPIGIDREIFAPAPFEARHENSIITTASADVPLKGLVYLIRAMKTVVTEIPEAKLTVIGTLRKGPTAEAIAELGLEDVVQFKSNLTHPEVSEKFQTATMLVSPSLYEGYGLPVAEALSCACPVVCTDGGSLPEVAGDAALIVPKGDSEALAQAIISLLKDKDLRQSYAEAGNRRAAAVFDWAAIAPRYEAVFREAMAQC